MKRIVIQTLAALSPKERKQFRTLVLCNCFLGAADIFALIIIVVVVGCYTGTTVSLPSWIPSNFAKGHSLMPAALLAALFVIKNLAGYKLITFQNTFASNISSRLSRERLEEYFETDYKTSSRIDSAVHIRNILYQTIEFSTSVVSNLLQASAEIFILLCTISLILWYRPVIFLSVAAAVAPPITVAAWILSRKLAAARTNVKRSNELALQHLNEALGGYMDVVDEDNRQFFVQRYAHQQSELATHLSSVRVSQNLPSRLIETFAACIILLVVALGTKFNIDVISAGALLAATYKIIPSITRFGSLSAEIQTYAYTIGHTSDPKLPATANEKEKVFDISMDEVCFSYENKLILNKICAHFKSGDIIGITGDSGIGKTTIANLLLGHLSPHSGTISFNGLYAHRERHKHIRARIAYCQQRPFFIHDTVEKNITLNGEEANQPRLERALKLSGLTVLTEARSEGLNYMVLENGRNLSGGQRQRLALARALYRTADVLLLDEALSELDQENAQEILHHLKHLASSGQIIIMITHDPSHLEYCTKTLRLSSRGINNLELIKDGANSISSMQ